MDASLIRNLPSAPQAVQSSSGTPTSAKFADAESVPSFAQVVREILVRTTTQSDTQPAHTLQSSSSAKTGKQGTISNVSPASGPATFNQYAAVLPVAPAPQPATTIANSKSPEAAAAPSADPTPAATSIPEQTILLSTFPELTSGRGTNQLSFSAASGAAVSNGDERSSVLDLPASVGSMDKPAPQNDKNLAAAKQLPVGNQLPAVDLPGVSAPLTYKSAAGPGQRSTFGIPDVRTADEGNNLTSTFQISAPKLPDAPPQSSDAEAAAGAEQFSLPAIPDPAGSIESKNRAADQQQVNAGNQIADSSSDRKPAADPQIPLDSLGSPNAAAISFLPPQSASWQIAATQSPSVAGESASSPAHSTLPQATNQSAFSAAQVAAALPAAFAGQVFSSKNVPSSQTTLPAVSLQANAPSPNRSGAQDSSSNTGAQKSSDSSAAPIPTVSHDTSVFSQALAAANNAKPQAAPSTGNQTLVTPPVTLPLNDRLAAPAAASLPPAPANPPEAAAHMLDGAPPPTVSDAQISQNSNHSEMRIAMQTDKLGAVELRAHLSGDELGAAITVEKRDAHAALAVELPSLQQALSGKQFRVDQITLLHSSLHSSTGNAGGQSQAQQGDRGAHRAQVAQSFLRDNSGAFISFQGTAENRGIFDSRGRLSVQA